MLGIIGGGTSLLFADLPALEKTTVATPPYGKAEVHTGAFALLLRHQHNLPPRTGSTTVRASPRSPSSGGWMRSSRSAPPGP
ncbi:hypothetical protein [Methanoculleus chikugoensis]|uniref:hypothetical protein n=1 Tax=Methanoculleus chikugoensis TaxID=118126 RepID=UPI000A86E4E5|nr:hypothetical protein [Methanoculleus chikugoensis]